MNNVKPLEGVRVIEMATYIAAPVAAKMLADWGAEVIKIEPHNGDVYRVIGRTLRMPVTEDQNPCFDLENSNKKGMSINIKTEEGQKILRKLIGTSDVLITNYRPEVLKKLNLTYEQLSEEFPSLVYGVLTGYGEKGPDKDRPGYDLTSFMARSGMMLDVVDKNGSPMSIVAAIGDHVTGTSLATGICAALYKKSVTGKGDKVVSGLYQNALYMFGTMIAGTHHGLQYPIDRYTSPSPIVNTYKCKDGEWILLAATNFDGDWVNVCNNVLDRPDLAENPKYNNIKGMIANTTEMVKIIEEIFATKDRDEWQERLIKADLAHEKVLHWKDVLQDEQAWANGYLREVTYANGGKSVLVNAPVTIDSVGVPEFKMAPKIGEHTTGILLELGYTEEEVNAFRENRFIK